MAEVSLDALSQAQTAFERFAHRLDALTHQTKKHHSEIIHQCQETIKTVEKQRLTIQDNVENLRYSISKQEKERHSIQKTIQYQQSLLQECEKTLFQLQKRQKEDQYTLSNLESGKKTTGTDGEIYLKMDYEGIHLLKHQIKSCITQIQEKETQIKKIKVCLSDLEEKIQVLKKEEDVTRLELEEGTQRLYRLETQEEQLGQSYLKLEEDLKSYLTATMAFSQKTLEKNENHRNSLTRCITAIEQYLAISLVSEDSRGNERKKT